MKKILFTQNRLTFKSLEAHEADTSAKPNRIFDPFWLMPTAGVGGSFERPVVQEDLTDEEERTLQTNTRQSLQSALT